MLSACPHLISALEKSNDDCREDDFPSAGLAVMTCGLAGLLFPLAMAGNGQYPPESGGTRIACPSAIRALCLLSLLFIVQRSLQESSPRRCSMLTSPVDSQLGLKAGLLFALVLLSPHLARAQQSPPSPAPSPAPDGSHGWVRIVPKPLSINGRRYSPTCSAAPGTSTREFSYYYRKGTADGLVVFSMAAAPVGTRRPARNPVWREIGPFSRARMIRMPSGFTRLNFCQAMAPPR